VNTTRLLRLEGAAIGVGALAAYYLVGGPLWLLAVLALAPDLAMAGYAAGPVVGARTYNAVHVYAAPVALALLGVAGDVALAQQAALVWAGHIGFDRALGYGLKSDTGFGDTHLTQ